MEIIRELEPSPRGAYCGAIGWAAPDGRAAFNVAIRTLTLWPDGQALLNVGGGIVADSSAAAEYEEALWKTRFADLVPAT
jgi:para-aminobenzoate synthetase component 1